MNLQVLLGSYQNDIRLKQLAAGISLPDNKIRVYLDNLRGSAINFIATAIWQSTDVNHVFILNDKEEAAYQKSLHPGVFEEWKSGLNLGFALTRGNSETKNLAIAFVATRQTLHDKLGAYANSVYASNDAPGAVPSTTANTAGGGFRYDHDIKNRLFGFVAADFFSDALQGLNIRAVQGGGLGFHAIKNDRTTLDFLGGLNYTHENYTVFTRNFAALTIGEDLTHKIGKSTVLSQDLNFFPNLSHTGEYRATFDFGTVTKMTHRLGWQNSFSDIYVTNPPAGKRQNDLVLTTGLNLSFGQ